MKVIKPLGIASITGSSTNTDVNARDLVPIWSSGVTYAESSTFDKIWVQYNETVYESLKPNNLNNTPSSGSTWWKTITTTAEDDFAIQNWSSNTTYSKDQIVVYWDGNAENWPKYYQSLINSNLNNIPPDTLTGVLPAWLDLGYTNVGKLYDIESNTQTLTTDELITTFTARKANSAGVFNVSGTKVLITAKSERNIYDNTSWSLVEDVFFTPQGLSSMCYSPDKNILLIAGSIMPELKYSQDNGTTWSLCTVPDYTIRIKSIAYSKEGQIFVAVGTSWPAQDTATIWKSSDGITWIKVLSIPTASVSLNKVIWIKQKGLFVAVASGGNIYTSDSTATTWTAASIGVGVQDLKDIVYNPANGLIHVLGTNSILRYSTDLSTWTSVSISGYNLIAVDVYNQQSDYYNQSSSQYVYLATNSTTGLHYLYYSTDGISWTQVQITLGSAPLGLTYCYTEQRWVLNCTTAILSWSQYSGFIDKTPLSYTQKSNLYYNKYTDTVFLIGNGADIYRSSVIFFQEYKLNTSLLDNWYDYFYKDYDLLSEAIFQDIPIYTRTRVTICIVGDIVRCGIVFAGASSTIGTTQYGASAGIIDYSKKETDEFGTTTFIKRAFSKRMNVNLILLSADMYRVQKILSDVRATPCIWIGSESDIYKPLTMYGYYRDFNLEIPYPEYSYCSLQVEGLTE
jgi:hypothetical protein